MSGKIKPMITRLLQPSTIRKLLLLFLVAGMAAFARKFAYWGLSSQTGLPVYVSEIVLAASLVLIFLFYLPVPRLRVRLMTPINGPLALYWLWGLVLLAGTLPVYGFDVLRDFVVVYYSLFIFVTIAALRTADDVRLLLYVLVAANLIPCLQVIQRIAQGGFTARGIYLRIGGGEIALFSVIGFVAVLVLYSSGSRTHGRRKWLLLLLPILTFGISGAQTRSIILALVGALGVLFAMLPLRNKRNLIKMLALVLVAVIVLTVILPNGVAVFSAQLPKYLAFFDTGEGSNAARLVNYQYALDRISASPIWGVGLGAPEFFNYGGSETLPVRSPHDSYLGIAFRMGVIELALFIFFLGCFYVYLVPRVMRINNPDLRKYAAAILAGQVAVAIMALFNVTLEGPQNGIIFWVLIGAALRVVQLAESKMEDQVPVRQRALSHNEPAPASLSRRNRIGGR